MTGDQVYFKFATSREWHGPATVLGHNGQQVLIKSDSTYIRVHPYTLQFISSDSTASSTLKMIIATVIMPQQQQNLIHRTKKQQIPQTHLTQKPKTTVVTEKHKQIELKQAQTSTPPYQRMFI